jgi:hypothetical protein
LKSIKVEQRASAAPRLFLQIFNTNSPTVGTTAPEKVVPVPAGSSNLDVSVLKEEFQGTLGGLHLSTGFAYAVTTTHDGNTAPTAGQEPVVVAHYENLG